MELHLRNLVFVTFVTLLSSGLIDAQFAEQRYGNTDANAGQMELVSFRQPNGVFGSFINYETTKIYRQVNPDTTPDNAASAATFNAADPGTELLLTWVDDSTPDGQITWANPALASRYMFDGDTQNLNPILTIDSLQRSDHGYYWAEFEDTNGGTNRPIAYSLVILDYYVNGVISLDNPATIDGCPATYTCGFATGFPRPTIVWTITPPGGGTPVDVSALADTDPRYTVVTSSVQNLVPPDTVANPGDPHTFTTTSMLTLTNPELLNTITDAAYDDNVVTCTATQQFTLLNTANAADKMNVATSTQTLDVLVEPKITNMRFEAMVGGTLMTFNNGDTISVNDNSPIVITAVVADVNPEATITFDTSNLTPLNAPNEGTEDSPTVAGTPLVTTKKTYTFTPVEANAGQALRFSTTNNAVTPGCKTAPGPVTLNFNVLAGPKANIIYTDPVSGNQVSIEVNAATSAAPDCSTSTNVINVLAGSNLAITCESIGVDPATTITIFRGDGGVDLTTGDTVLGTSDTSHVTEPTPNNFNTVFTRTLMVPPIGIANNNDVITCRAMNNMNQVVYTAACLKFLDPPDSIEMYTGSGQTTLATSPAVGDLGSPLEFNCVAQDANPAAGIFWRLPSSGSTDLLDTDTSAVDTNLFFDTTSVLSNTLTYADTFCNMQLSCTTMHTESGNPNPVSDMVQLQVRVPPTTVMLQFLATSDPVSVPPSTVDIVTDTTIADDGSAVVLAGMTYNLRGTTDNSDPSSAIVGTRRSDATTIVHTYPNSLAQGTTVTCTPAPTSHALTITPTCADYDGQRICVEADNTHNAAAIITCVILEVRVPVTTVTMTISAGATAVTPTGGTFTLTAGVAYTVVCRVTGAKPDPTTGLFLDDSNDSVQNGVEVVGATSDNTGGTCDRVSTLTYTFTPTHATHCGRRLYCQSLNEANALIGPASPGSVEYTLQLIVPPTSVAVPTISMASTTYTNADTVKIDAGTSYTFTCTSAMAEETPDIKWNLIHPTTSASTEIGRRILNASPDCTLEANTNDVMITADFVMHNNFRLQCLTETDTGSSSSEVILNVDVASTGLTMLDGGVNAQNMPTGTAVTAPSVNFKVGDNAEFTCQALNGNPDTTAISWTRGGAAQTGTQMSSLRADDSLYDTVNTLSFTAAYSMCNEMLMCSGNHPDTNTDLTPASTQLKVAVAPTSTAISLQSAGSCTTGLTLPDSDGTVIIVHGVTNYLFQCAVTLADEEATITFNHRNAANNADIGTNPLATLAGTETAGPDCMQEPDTGDYTLSADYDTHDNTNLQCCAENSANTGNPMCAETVLDVQVKASETNMEIVLQDDNGDPVQADSLKHGTTYRIICVVPQATPPPTIAIVDPSGTSSAGTAATAPYVNVAAGAGVQRMSILTASTRTFVANSANCNAEIRCEASNSANTLCGDATQTVRRQVKIATAGPTTTRIALTSGTGVTAVPAGTAISATVVDGVNNNMFQVAVEGADEEASVTCDLVNNLNAVIPSVAGFPLSFAAVETTPDCTAQADTEDLTLTADFATQDGNKVQCCAQNSGSTTPMCARATLDVQIPVKNTVKDTVKLMEMIVKHTDGTVIDLATAQLVAGQSYTIDCIVREATPAPTIAISFPTPLGLAVSPDVTNMAKGPSVARANIVTAMRATYAAVAANCGMTLTCLASNAANTDTPSIPETVNINAPLNSSPTIEVNPTAPNQDQDGNSTDASASLFRNTAYVFDCKFPADTVNPPPHIRWDLYDDTTPNPVLLHTATDQNGGSPDCIRSAVTESYDLTAERVTFESLNGGFLVCTAYTNDVPLVAESPNPYVATNLHKAIINFVILTPPSGITFDDYATDDDGDGDMNDPLSPDPVSNKLPLCEGDSFDLKATAVASNPALTSFDITLGGTTLGSGVGVTISLLDPPSTNAINNMLLDTSVTVTLAASFVTNARNGQILKICAPNSAICNQFTIDIVASPQDPPTLTVSDPFAPRDPAQANPRTLTDGNALRLHYNKAYTFTCSAQNARPAAELVFSLVDPLTSVVLQPTNQVDTADGNGFDSVRTVIYTPGNLDATGHKLCCTATNDATKAGCTPATVNICVDLEIIEEPEDLKMYQRMQSSTTGRRKRQAAAGFEEITEQYTDLAADANFDIRCVAERSAPAAVIEWSITLPNNAALSANLAASLTATGEAATPSGNALASEVDQGSTIMLMTTPETLGATVECCAHHVAIPGGTNDGLGGVYDIDPSLDVRCKNTTIRFPVGAQSIQIWLEKGSSATRQTFTNGALVKANADEPLQLHCTAFGSRPYVYIGWTGMNPSSQSQDNSFISSDCQFTVVDSPTSNADPLTQTVDTTKCVNLLPKEEHHGREVYCTGTNIADDTGDSVIQHVVLDLCVPCKNSLKIQDFGSSSGSTYADGMDVVLLAGNSRTLECSAKGREQPVIDFYIQEEGKARKKLTLADGVIATTPTQTGNIAGLYEVKIRFEISMSNTQFKFSGATLTCECVNAIDNKESKGSTSVVLKAFDVGPTQTNTLIGTGNSNSFAANLVIAPDGKALFFLSISGIVSGGTNSDPFSGSNFPAASNVFNLTRRKRQTNQPSNQLTCISRGTNDPFSGSNFPAAGNVFNLTRRKRQTNQPSNQLTCISRGTNPAVDFIWKLDGQVITGQNIETTSQSSILNVGNEGLVDTFSTFSFDPLYRGYHSRELCCEVSSSLIGSPIRQCVNLAVFSGPNDPMQVDGTRVVNEGQTVQLKCTATDHYPVGVFSWEDDAGNTAPVSNANQIQTPPKLLPNFRYEESSTYSFVTRREDNGKEIICEFDQNHNENGVAFTHKTTEKIPISVNFCPTSSAELTGCPNAPVAPGRDVTIQCQSAVSNPPLQLQWRMNNVVQNPSTPAVDQLRGYGFVTSQSFTTRQLALVDDGIQIQCCPEHTIPSIGCNQFCSPACTINVAQPTADPGCQWNRVEMTLDRINGNPATWDRDYANHQSSKYQDVTNGLLGVMQQVLDGQPDYRSAILPTLVESTDGLIQAIFGVEFNSPYRSTTSDVQKAIADATNDDGNLVGDGGVVSSYQILPNSATVVCVCEGSYCLQGAACRPSDDDYSSTCTCPADYTGPRCETYLPGQPTRPPSGGVKYARIGFILAEINNQPATWKNEYNDATNSETRDLINSLDSTLTPVFEAPFTTCFVNVRIADLFQSTGGTVGVIAGVELSNGACDQSIDDVRNEFIKSVDGDQRIGGSGYKLNSNYLQETNVEEICGNDFSCSNSGTCQPSDNDYYSSCRCNPGYTGDRCQTIIRIPVTQSPGDGNDSGSGGLSQNVLIGIIIGVVLFAAIVIGLCLLCCFLFGGDRERVRTRYIYSDEEEPRRGYATPPKNGSYPLRGRGKAYDDWPWSSDGRPPVAYNGGDMFDFDSRGGRGDLGPRPAF